jgi:hypothetical protein
VWRKSSLKSWVDSIDAIYQWEVVLSSLRRKILQKKTVLGSGMPRLSGCHRDVFRVSIYFRPMTLRYLKSLLNS